MKETRKRKKTPSIVDEAINNQHNRNAIDIVHHNIYHIPKRKKEPRRLRAAINNGCSRTEETIVETSIKKGQQSIK